MSNRLELQLDRSMLTRLLGKYFGSVVAGPRRHAGLTFGLEAGVIWYPSGVALPVTRTTLYTSFDQGGG